MYSLLLMRALKISSELKKSEFCILSVMCIYVIIIFIYLSMILINLWVFYQEVLLILVNATAGLLEFSLVYFLLTYFRNMEYSFKLFLWHGMNHYLEIFLAHLSWKIKWAFLGMLSVVSLSVIFSYFHLLLQNHCSI